MKVVFTTLYLGNRPTPQFVRSLEDCISAVDIEGWEHQVAIEQNCPYISAARSKLIRKALDANADVIVFLDYDIAWTPKDMVHLLRAEGDVVAGTYRFKKPEEEYMGALEVGPNGLPLMRPDGALEAFCVPAGFLKVTKVGVNKFAKQHPNLMFGMPMSPDLDMFNHGVIDGIWFGEDYAFCKRWKETGEKIWLLPDLDIDHMEYKGNFHKYLLRHKHEKESC